MLRFNLVISCQIFASKYRLILLSPTGSTSVKAARISYDNVSERVTLTFDQEIPSGEALLSIEFTATINEAMAGFSRCKYKAIVTPSSATPELDGFHYMMSTQFEACDARRAFPCFDEPNLKAEFDFEIEVPKDLVALSNMPVKSERDGSKKGWKVVSFERTPIMSTYVGSTLGLPFFKLICVHLAFGLGSRRFWIRRSRNRAQVQRS